MKTIQELTKSLIPKKEEVKLIHAIQDAFFLKHLDAPIMSSDAKCPMCGGNNGHVVLIDPSLSDKRMWFCEEPYCMSVVKQSKPKPSEITHIRKRAIEWPLFCEINNMGDLVHDITFEKMDQSNEKKEYLLKFSNTPRGIIIMKGVPGTGKTYASMALCELFTRNNSSCLFFTADQLSKQWIESFKSERASNFKERVMQTNLLVIDDFGTGEPTSSFLGFFMEIINTRMQWSNRGTVITTNLSDDDLSKFCGNALSDRLKTGQKFNFTKVSRRQKSVL